MLTQLEIQNPEGGRPYEMIGIDYNDDQIFSHMHTLGKIFKEEIITTIDHKIYTYDKKRESEDINSLLTIDRPDAYKNITFDLFRRELFLEKTLNILRKIEDTLHHTPHEESNSLWEEANWLFILSGEDINSVNKLIEDIEVANTNLACCQSNLLQQQKLSGPELFTLNHDLQHPNSSLDEVLVTFFITHYRLLCAICPELSNEERNFIASFGFIG